MKITIVALGTRGDVQPVIALSKGLLGAGHQVRVIAGSNFESWVRSHGLDYLPSVDIETVMNSESGRAWSESSNSPTAQLREMRTLLDQYGHDMIKPIVEAAGDADLLISGFTSESYVQAVCEKLGKRYVSALLQPYQVTSSGAASLQPIIARGSSILNRLMNMMVQRMLWGVVESSTNKLRAQLQLSAHSAPSYNRSRRGTPTVFGFSRYVVPPAQDWPRPNLVSGYWFLDEDEGYEPSAELAAFLAAGEPPVYIGFGSMSSRDPQATLKVILAALAQLKRRAIIASGWSGLKGENLPEYAFVLDKAPHGWLFERVAAVVHHGGAGTTAAGLRAGKPTMIVPHMSDQPYWGRRVFELGVGVKPVPRHKLTAEALAKGIAQLTTDRGMAAKAAELGGKIRGERGVENAVAAIERFGRLVVKDTR